MKIFASLQRVCELLSQNEVEWAICGGIAACLYRETPRYTGDIDIALTGGVDQVADIAKGILASLGYKPILGHVTDHKGKLIEGKALLMGREDDSGNYLGIDFLLPVLPWIPTAVSRAQDNTLDYGFSKLPTVWPADLIIAKLYALNGTPDRKHDLDDIESILQHLGSEVDKEWILGEAQKHGLLIPDHIRQILHSS